MGMTHFEFMQQEIAYLRAQLAASREEALKERASYEARIAELAFKVDEANENVLRVVRGEFGQICSYCGWESSPEGASWEELQTHINVCESHPVATLKIQVADLTAKLEELQRLQDRAFDMLYLNGVTKERAKAVCNGIDVLATRFRKEVAALTGHNAFLASKLAAKESAESSRDWSEDFSQENGNYECKCYKCGNSFVGHKRRIVCKLCVAKESAEQEPLTDSYIQRVPDKCDRIIWRNRYYMLPPPNNAAVAVDAAIRKAMEVCAAQAVDAIEVSDYAYNHAVAHCVQAIEDLPADDTALREVCLKIATIAMSKVPGITFESSDVDAIVDEVLGVKE